MNEITSMTEFMPKLTEEQIAAEIELGKKLRQQEQLLSSKTKRLEELTKDFAQVQAGFEIDDLEERKAEFRQLLNEVRELQGKAPRKLLSDNANNDISINNNTNTNTSSDE